MRTVLFAIISCLYAIPGIAMVGGAPASSEGLARSVVTVVGSRGTFCSGALIAPDLVLSAAHCTMPGADYKIVIPGETPPRLIDVRRIALHPQFNVQGIQAHRASADVALLQLAEPVLKAKVHPSLSAPSEPLALGNRFIVAGVGVTIRGDGKSGGTVRAASLVVTGKPGRLQIRLVDPATNNTSDGLGACTGDSGAPVFEDQNGRTIIVGVVSWSTGANNSSGCGGLTGVTPLTLYREWIERTARNWGARAN